MTSIRIDKNLHSVLGLFFWLAISADAHSGDRLFPIPYLSDEMLSKIKLQDGTIDEWIELVGEPSMTSLDFTTGFGRLPPDPSDLDFRIWLAWHDDPARFYVSFVASDDVYKNTHNYNVGDTSSGNFMFLNDSITLIIDGDHSGGAGCSNDCLEEDWLHVHSQSQHYDAIARTSSGPTLDDLYTRQVTEEFAWTALPPYGDGGGGVFGEAPAISIIELFVTPFDWLVFDRNSIAESVISDLTTGKVIGFAISVNDWDREDIWVNWTPVAMQGNKDSAADIGIFGIQPDTFLDGLLLPADPTLPEEDTAVESISWGLIKASLNFR